MTTINRNFYWLYTICDTQLYGYYNTLFSSGWNTEVIGFGNVVVANSWGANITATGDNNTLTGYGARVNVGGWNNSVNVSNSSWINVRYGSAYVNGSRDYIQMGNGATTLLSGDYNSIAGDNGCRLTLNGWCNTVNLNNGSITISNNAGNTTINGSYDWIQAGYNVSMTVTGYRNTINGNSGDRITINGTLNTINVNGSCVTSTGWCNNINGNNNNITISGCFIWNLVVGNGNRVFLIGRGSGSVWGDNNYVDAYADNFNDGAGISVCGRNNTVNYRLLSNNQTIRTDYTDASGSLGSSYFFDSYGYTKEIDYYSNNQRYQSLFYDRGQLYEMDYFSNNLKCQSLLYSNNRVTGSSSYSYVNNKISRVDSFNAAGQKTQSFCYDGNGNVTEQDLYGSNGQKVSACLYTNGQMTEQDYYNSNGRYQKIIIYTNGKVQEVNDYDSNGNKIQTCKYDNGVVVQTIQYTYNGNDLVESGTSNAGKQLLKVVKFLNGRLSGVDSYTNIFGVPSRTIVSHETYLNGQKDNTIYYTDNGTTSFVEHYDDKGQIIGTDFYLNNLMVEKDHFDKTYELFSYVGNQLSHVEYHNAQKQRIRIDNYTKGIMTGWETWSYDSSNLKQAKITGHVIYNAKGQIIEKFSYSKGLVTEDATFANGVKIASTTFSYDCFDRVLYTDYYKNGERVESNTTFYGPGGYGNYVSDKVITRCIYPEHGVYRGEVDFYKDEKLVEVVDRGFAGTEWLSAAFYDITTGRVTSKTFYQHNDPSQVSSEEKYIYDANGKKIETDIYNSQKQIFEKRFYKDDVLATAVKFDEHGYQIEEDTYAADGSLILFEKDINNANTGIKETAYFYSGYNDKLVAVRRYNGAMVSEDIYDGQGQRRIATYNTTGGVLLSKELYNDYQQIVERDSWNQGQYTIDQFIYSPNGGLLLQDNLYDSDGNNHNCLKSVNYYTKDPVLNNVIMTKSEYFDSWGRLIEQDKRTGALVNEASYYTWSGTTKQLSKTVKYSYNYNQLSESKVYDSSNTLVEKDWYVDNRISCSAIYGALGNATTISNYDYSKGSPCVASTTVWLPAIGTITNGWYAAFGGSTTDLFRPTRFDLPAIQDVNQGGMGDCYIEAAAAALASRQPNFVQTMFKEDKKTNTVSVRLFYTNSQGELVPEWITVDNSLAVAVGGNYYGNTSTPYAVPDSSVTHMTTWVTALEKAFCVYRYEHGFAGKTFSSVSYDNINVGGNWDALQAMTGRKITDIEAYAYTSDKWSTQKQTVIDALYKAEIVLFASSISTTGTNGKLDLVEGHEFAITGYDKQTDRFTLYNPWGVNAPKSGTPANTTFEQTWQQLYDPNTLGIGTGSIYIANSHSQSSTSGQLSTAGLIQAMASFEPPEGAGATVLPDLQSIAIQQPLLFSSACA